MSATKLTDTLLAIGIDEVNSNHVKLAIRREDGFELWVTLNPESAVDVAESLARHSYTAKYGEANTVVTLKDEVINRKRATLIQRCKIIIPQLLERHRDAEYIASTIIDLTLKEVA